MAVLARRDFWSAVMESNHLWSAVTAQSGYRANDTNSQIGAPPEIRTRKIYGLNVARMPIGVRGASDPGETLQPVELQRY